jgi:hypothetical protein
MAMMLSMSDNDEMQPGGMDLDEARLHGTRGDGDELPKDTCHGTRGDGDEMPKDQDEATARDDDGFFDSVMATGTCHGTRGGGGHMTKHQATGSLRERTKSKTVSIRKGTKRPLEGTVVILDDDFDDTDDKRQASPRTTTSGPTRWRKGLVSRCEDSRRHAIPQAAEATARDN